MARSRAAALAAAVEEPVQTTLDDGVPLPRGDVRRGRPRDDGRLPGGLPDHRGRCREDPRRRAARLVLDAREPAARDPRDRSRTSPGSTTRLVAGAPPIEWVLPSFAEFARGCVFVAHNATFDFTFLNVALRRLDYEPLDGPPVCTSRLARRVVWPDVPNTRLHTLAQYFRTAVRPNHRALPDAEACAEVLHGLLELGGRLGIRTLGELHAAVRAQGPSELRQDPARGRSPRAPRACTCSADATGASCTSASPRTCGRG